MAAWSSQSSPPVHHHHPKMVIKRSRMIPLHGGGGGGVVTIGGYEYPTRFILDMVLPADSDMTNFLVYPLPAPRTPKPPMLRYKVLGALIASLPSDTHYHSATCTYLPFEFCPAHTQGRTRTGLFRWGPFGFLTRIEFRTDQMGNNR